jgi:hypothetical protein
MAYDLGSSGLGPTACNMLVVAVNTWLEGGVLRGPGGGAWRREGGVVM